MKAATTLNFGLNSKIGVKEITRPKIRPDEVLVKVHASSVNPKDWKFNVPIYSLTPNFLLCGKNQVLGDDLSGIIVEKGDKVVGFDVGDEIYGMSMKFRTGACAEFAAISELCIARKPKNMSYSEAAAVPLAGLTALQCLRAAKIDQGSKVLIIGASGGVGSYTVQLAKAMGAQVTTVCSGRNLELVKSLGADELIDYTREDFKINENYSNNFDAIIDATAYENPFVCSSLLKPLGIFVTPGGQRTWGLVIPASIMNRKRKFKTLLVSANKHDLETLKQYIENGQLRSVIDSNYSLANIDQAYKRSQSARACGKIVISLTANGQ